MRVSRPEGFSFLLLPVLVLTLVAGSVPARGQTVMELTQIRASGMKFDPTRDGFGFQNFPNTPEKWTVSDAVVRKLFGGDACSSGTVAAMRAATHQRMLFGCSKPSTRGGAARDVWGARRRAG